MSPKTPDDAKGWVEEAKSFYVAAGKRIALPVSVRWYPAKCSRIPENGLRLGFSG